MVWVYKEAVCSILFCWSIPENCRIFGRCDCLHSFFIISFTLKRFHSLRNPGIERKEEKVLSPFKKPISVQIRCGILLKVQYKIKDNTKFEWKRDEEITTNWWQFFIVFIVRRRKEEVYLFFFGVKVLKFQHILLILIVFYNWLLPRNGQKKSVDFANVCGAIKNNWCSNIDFDIFECCKFNIFILFSKYSNDRKIEIHSQNGKQKVRSIKWSS